MKNYKRLLKDILMYGQPCDTRSGKTLSIFGEMLEFDLTKGFPAITSKKLMFKGVIGELLWFLNGENRLESLRFRSNIPKDKWTIWSDDCERWRKSANFPREFDLCDDDYLGYIYGVQWREFGVIDNIDQISNLIDRLKNDPHSRYHLVTAWNPEEIDKMALPPCHYAFQCYVRKESDGKKYLDLMWHQRSVDTFLGLPFNIASYAALTHILAKLTGLEAGRLKVTLGDVHIYQDHLEAVDKLLNNEIHPPPQLILPEMNTLEDLYPLTAKDFSLKGYNHSGQIKAKLSVG